MNEPTPQDFLLERLRAGDFERVRSLLGGLHPSEIADLLESLPGREREQLWGLVAPEAGGEVLSEVQDAVRAGLLERLAPRRLAEALRDLDTDDVADILQDLPQEAADTVLLAMDEQHRQRIASLLSYPEDTAGGLMNTDVVSVRADVSLDTVARYLRQRGGLPTHTDSLMVVDRENRYLGILPLAEVLARRAELTVGEIMTAADAIPANAASREVARRFEQRDLLSAAVVDADGKLLGRITVDDVVDVIQEEAGHTVLSLAGLAEDDTFASALRSGKRRALWLGVNLLTAFFASWVIGRFENTIQQLVALAILMPIVASMGGIAGNQTLTIAIRALALGQLNKTSARRLIAKEIAVGLLNGGVWALVVGALAWLWFGDAGLGLIIALAMTANLLIAAIAGACIPLSLHRAGIDPALAGGVILTTITDVVGFMTFLGLATLFLLP